MFSQMKILHSDYKNDPGLPYVAVAASIHAVDRHNAQWVLSLPLFMPGLVSVCIDTFPKHCSPPEWISGLLSLVLFSVFNSRGSVYDFALWLCFKGLSAV
jgi:hypothetical protein